MSEKLKQFYQELQEWIDNGCKDNDVFRCYRGICHCLDLWGGDGLELRLQFRSASLCDAYPWGEDDFNERVDNDTIYECPRRLAWIKEHAQ